MRRRPTTPAQGVRISTVRSACAAAEFFGESADFEHLFGSFRWGQAELFGNEAEIDTGIPCRCNAASRCGMKEALPSAFPLFRG